MTHRGASDLTSVDQVDFGPPDLDHTQVTNGRPLISLMKSDGCDNSSHPANRGVTRGFMWMADIKEEWSPRRGNVSIYRTRHASIVIVHSFFSESDGPDILR